MQPPRSSYFGGNLRHNQEKIFPWENEAKEVMKVYKPKCIVLDLDFTLWPTFFSSHTMPPYVPLTGISSKVLCVDKMTNKPRMLTLYPEVLHTIKFCLENDIMVSIASKNSNKEDAQAILQSLGIWHHLHFPQIFYSRKTYHFRNLKSITKFDYEDFMFFDDDIKNVTVCKNIGVNSFRVHRANGFNGKALLLALKQCAEKYEVLKNKENDHMEELRMVTDEYSVPHEKILHEASSSMDSIDSENLLYNEDHHQESL